MIDIFRRTDKLQIPDSVQTVDISIVIPSFNRGQRVRETVEQCLKLRPAPREIVLVDDHSGVESEQLLRGLENGTVKYVRTSENGGQALARSIGLATAKGKYLVSLDDDSWFLEEDALERVWNRFEQTATCGVLAFRCFTPRFPPEPPRERLFLVSDHITCGAAYRTEVLRKVGYHLTFLRFVSEENDISIKVFGAGFDVILDENIRVFHDYDPTKRSAASLARVRRYGTRNDLLQAWVYFPWDLAMGLTLWRACSQFLHACRRGFVGSTLRGYAGFVGHFPQALLHRHPIGRAAALKYLRLRQKPKLLSGHG